MVIQVRNFATRLSGLTLIVLTGLCFFYGQAQEKHRTVEHGLEKEIHQKVDKSFRFVWRYMFDKQAQPLKHRFFSIAFDVNKNGEYTDIIPSTHMDTAIFFGSIERMKRELPKDLFKTANIRNTKVVFPVFIFVVPQTEDTLYFDTPTKRNPNFKPDTLSYDKLFNQQLEEIWQFNDDQSIIRQGVVFPPIIYVVKRGIPDMEIKNDPDHFKKKHPFESKRKTTLK